MNYSCEPTKAQRIVAYVGVALSIVGFVLIIVIAALKDAPE